MTKQAIVPIKHNPHPIQHNKYDNWKNQPQLKIRIQQIEITFYDSLNFEAMSQLLDKVLTYGIESH
ncbi:hypothetical protein IU403_01770 [Aerococcaceae bacterium zg-BR22]|uniref:hypothetical protein n=1 Tax=Aerococcaceae bacterium zg-1292 TaxID=2774330 RepID=UPI0040640908|nr:hypothetical protein [Aerococcaceae bacterium zg-BR22]